MEMQDPGRQCNLAIIRGQEIPEVAIGEGFVSESFLTKYGFLNSGIVSILVDFSKEPFRAHESSFKNPLSGGVPHHKALSKKVQRNSFLHLKVANSLELLENSSDRNNVLPLVDDSVYVTEETAFNICKRNPVAYQHLYKTGDCHALIGANSLTYQIVDKIIVSTVQTTCDAPVKLYDEALQQFFKIPRMLNNGDIFCSTVDTKRLRQLGLAKANLQLWFVVSSLEKAEKELDFGLISREYSTLICQGSSNAYIVPSSESPLTDVFFSDDLLGPGAAEVPPAPQTSIFTAARFLQNKLLCLVRGGKPADLTLMISGAVGTGKTQMVREICLRFGMHLLDVNCCHVSGDSTAATEKRMKNIFNQSASLAPAILYLQNVDSLCKGKEGNDTELRLCRYLAEMIRAIDSPVLVVGATTCNHESIHAELLRIFTYSIQIAAPVEEERRTFLQCLMTGVRHCAGVSPSQIAKRCAGMLLGDLQALVCFAIQNSVDRMKMSEGSSYQTCDCTVFNSEESPSTVSNYRNGTFDGAYKFLDCSDVDKAIQKLINERADDLDMPKVPQVSWADVGGLTDAKREIMDTIQVPMLYPDLVAKGLRRSGILFYGPPGCGKTLLAKAVATELNLNFMAVKGPELLNMYVGQSEQNVRNIFARARTASPCIVFFDELDSLAPLRGRSGDSGGVMDRVVAQLLAELDGIHSGADIFIIGATNRPDLVDPALLRPGRFDKVIYVGISSNKDDRLRILTSILRKTNLDANVRVEDIESCCPSGMTGADFASICSDATVNAYRRTIRQIESHVISNSDNKELQTPSVSMEDFRLAIKSLIPSVAPSDLAKYKSIRKSYQ